MSGSPILVLLLALSRSSAADCAPDTAPTPAGPEAGLPARSYGLRQIAFDARYLVRRPLTLERRGRVKLWATAGSALALFVLREEIRESVQDHRRESRSRFLDDARTLGKGGIAPALALTAWATSFATHNDRERETAVLLLESMGASAALAWAGSYTLAFQRPEEGEALRFFDRDGHGVSLDAALAASIIPPLRRQYLYVDPQEGRTRRFWKRAATVLLYSGAGLTAYQRLDRDQHWAPDAFLGLMTGLGVGETLVDAHDDVKRRKARLDVQPSSSGLGLGFRLPLGRPRAAGDRPRRRHPRLGRRAAHPGRHPGHDMMCRVAAASRDGGRASMDRGSA